MTGNDRRWVTISDAAAILGKSERTIRRWVAQDKLDVDRAGPVMRVDIAGHAPDVDQAAPVSDRTTPDAAGIAELQAKVAQLEAEAQDLRAKVDRLAAENTRLETESQGLQNLLDQVAEERDYLRQANAAALSKIPGQRPSIWRRLLPWLREESE